MNDRALCSAGTLVPLTGRPSHLAGYPNFGHHNIAWELNGDPRFQSESGTLNALASEIARAASPVVVLTSEDFEYLHVRPAALHELARAMREIGYRVEFIAFLRPQAEYAESLYLTLLPFGMDLRFPEFLEIILRDGAVTFADRWVFRFDYTKLLEALAEVAGPHGISVRRYHQDGESRRLLAEFASIVVAQSGEPTFDRLNLPGRMSPRTSLEAACEFTTHSPALHRFMRDAAAAGSLWNDEYRDLILERFGADNEALARVYGLHLPELGSADADAWIPQPASFIQ